MFKKVFFGILCVVSLISQTLCFEIILMKTNDMENLYNDNHMNSIKVQAISSENLRLHNYFDNNMVLNWEGDAIYGFSSLQSLTVMVTYSSFYLFANPDSTGFWKVLTPPFNTSSSHTITISSSLGDSLQISNVYFGPTFRCSGQSNNVVTMADMKTKIADLAYAVETNYHGMHVMVQTLLGANATANNLANCQLYPNEDINFKQFSWTSPENPSMASRYGTLIGATCIYKARGLWERYGRAYRVGVLENAVSSTIIESHARPEVTQICNAYSSYRVPVSYFNQIGCVHNAMYWPTRHTNFTEELWYQGESNRNATEYKCLLPTYIQDKRDNVYQKQTVFNVVQLHPFIGNALLPRYTATREAQYAVLQLPGVCMIYTPHIGDPVGRTATDFGLHTGYKYYIMDQMTLCHMHFIEGLTVDLQGPTVESAVIPYSGGNITVTFNNTDFVVLNNTVGYPGGCLSRNSFQIQLSNGSWVFTGMPSSSIIVSGKSLTIPYINYNSSLPVAVKLPIYEDNGCWIFGSTPQPGQPFETTLRVSSASSATTISGVISGKGGIIFSFLMAAVISVINSPCSR